MHTFSSSQRRRQLSTLEPASALPIGVKFYLARPALNPGEGTLTQEAYDMRQ